ncbi:hypothetical protein M9H77_35140 [Catharanthus roseus]|uniref:Uncharacterized protein n=1 Tax=Catharanthus roseus TaxID=4058 RepID=A0ACB9ZRU5_CATRO|nr:hypothetical protein M9H77_35140 [Catharanthus roseus]
MEAIHPVRVILFWGSKIARDVYGPYFTGVVRKSWTLPTTRMISHNELEGIHILVEFEQIQQHSIPITHDKNTTNMIKHIIAVTHMVSDEPSMLYTIVNNDDDELDMRFVDKEQTINAAGTKSKLWKFDCVMNEIQERNMDAYIYLMKLDPEKWTLLHNGGHIYGIMTTNISEALNSVLKKARVLPLKPLVELIFNKLVKYFH